MPSGLPGVGFLSILSSMSKRPFPWSVFIIFLLAITLPYGYAGLSTGGDAHFNGFLLNPIDGYSYLAKIEQGRSGNWLFQLPFTSQPNAGSPLFLYYLFLGHIARICSLSSLAVFHVARLINAVILFAAIWIAVRTFLPKKSSGWVELIVALGGGTGWLILPWVTTPTDFWVAEAYPFLAAYTNPHFPLAIALLVAMIVLWKRQQVKWGFAAYLLLGLVLSLIQPFGVVIIGVVLGVDWLFQVAATRKSALPRLLNLFSFAIGGLPYSIWLLAVVQHDPILAKWNLQNITPSPTVIDLVLSFSPGLLIVIAGAIYALRKRFEVDRLLVLWMTATLGLSFIPFSLQRRFLLSASIPVSMLAISFIFAILPEYPKLGSALKKIYLPLSFITPVLVLIIGVTGITSRNPYIFIPDYTDFHNGAEWLQSHAGKDAVVFADPQTSLYLPAQAGTRVVYGHPFETPDAKIRKDQADQCFSHGNLQTCHQVLDTENVDYIWVNSSDAVDLQGGFSMYSIVYSSKTVTIYAVD